MFDNNLPSYFGFGIRQLFGESAISLLPSVLDTRIRLIDSETTTTPSEIAVRKLNGGTVAFVVVVAIVIIISRGGT